METLIITSRKDLEEIIQSAVKRELANLRKDEPEKLLSINQVAKRLGIAHSTARNKVTAGIIRSTPDGLIPENALVEYLNQTTHSP